jgi:DedD protein
MNPELKNRLIGAAVVTALATIFLPMLFDDPVDNKGQSVSELSIPATPIKSTETSANKLPTPATKTPTAPNDDAAVNETEMVDDADSEANAEPPVNDSPTNPADATEDPPVAIAEEAPLDTGVVPEAKVPTNKKSAVKPVTVATAEDLTKPVKKSEANTPKLLPVAKPTKPVEVAATTKLAVKKPEPPVAATKPIATKPAPTTTPIATKSALSTTPPVASTEKPAKAELSRWVIHAGSFSQKENATTLMKSLREQGIPVTLETIPAAKGSMYRLKVGPELDKKKAAANKAKLDKQGVGNVMFSE